MPLPYHPRPGTVVICDFSTGFRSPEMVKRRLAVTISPKLKRRNDLVTIVPLSATPPDPLCDWHCQIDIAPPDPWGDMPRWAKCDMLATVGYWRLNLPYEKHAVTGTRKYVQIELPEDLVMRLRIAAGKAIGLG
ncbi:type II toxin-antitoxin system PemK/MazF family toxin [Sphingobium sp. HWE2-09]|uniref:type II toxin-antitoxin system PemK/MazF family toxin n=1 Tax=Sphingobium sp. HWE2-09 TaxID=3108390 RepID=UPI002DC972F4|nr:type II toxin-antitoxin system PemK/MazF family toxin [Sphingobium sp. HWE2-09]